MKKRKDLSIKEKVAILESYDKLPKMGNERLLQNCKYPSHFSAKFLKITQALRWTLKKTKICCAKEDWKKR